MKTSRKRKRQLKKKLKILLIAIPVVIVVFLILIFGFRINNVQYTSDINQYNAHEIESYLEYHGYHNTLWFCISNAFGWDDGIDLFEDYEVSMSGPGTLKITAYEKKIKGYVNRDGVFYYISAEGKVVKQGSDKLKGVTKITGIDLKKINLYETIESNDSKQIKALTSIIKGVEDYDYEVKRINISSSSEISIFIKNIRVDFGKSTNLDKKLKKFNDIYPNAIKYRGILNMKHVATDGSYTLTKTPKKKHKNKKNKKK